MRALSIRQPYAELILRGIKTLRLRSGQALEYRSRATRIVGERFHLYAAGKRRPGRPRPAASPRLFADDLPTGVIVGSAVIA